MVNAFSIDATNGMNIVMTIRPIKIYTILTSYTLPF